MSLVRVDLVLKKNVLLLLNGYLFYENHNKIFGQDVYVCVHLYFGGQEIRSKCIFLLQLFICVQV